MKNIPRHAKTARSVRYLGVIRGSEFFWAPLGVALAVPVCTSAVCSGLVVRGSAVNGHLATAILT